MLARKVPPAISASSQLCLARYHNPVAEWSYQKKTNVSDPSSLELHSEDRDGRLEIQQFAPWNYKVNMDGFPIREKSRADRRAVEDDRACQISTLGKTSIAENLRVISRSIPSFWHSQGRLSSALLIRMAEDVEEVFDRALALKRMLPNANLAALLGQRPELLLHEDFMEVAPAVAGLQSLFPEVDIDVAVSRQPYFLIGPVSDLIQELKQLPQTSSAAHQTHFLMRHLETSAILHTQTYKRHKKRALMAYSKPRRDALQPVVEF